ncbi:predicted protein [Lichtheimia corymbifera JMRC:FSU:9682]|uniref:Uncharacterized protein n=1 Tax=Lichtheimia corymbifera JMRC:FSU:9682 TaxID=1263082 RepID=A0A068RUA5_9FUNG|nr:predicted protein [Lichtheimia corymbifera JMRC:FSU:9682]
MLKQEYPPTQVQPQSSATRDDGHWQPPHFDYAALDKVDAEAGSILIALANQEPLKTTAIDDDHDTVMVNNKPNDHNNSNNNNSHSSMSINNLLGGGGGGGGSSALTPQQQRHSNDNDASNKPSDPVTTSDPIMLLAAAAAAIDGRPGTNGTHAPSSNTAYTSTSERRLGDSGYGYYSQYYSSSYPKTKQQQYSYHGYYDDIRARRDRRMASPPDGYEQRRRESAPVNRHRPERGTNVFSYQYISMKQNPRIKRNAMHAYITYMIYTDMTHQDRMRTKLDGGHARKVNSEEYDAWATRKPSEGRIEASTLGASTYHRRGSGSVAPPPPPPTAHGGMVHAAPGEPPQPKSWYTSTGSGAQPPPPPPPTTATTTTTTPTAAAAAATTTTATSTATPSHYRLPPSPSTPHQPTSSRQSSPSQHNGNSNAIMMGRPLTAFLRDGPSDRPLPPPFSSTATATAATVSGAGNGRSSIL